MPNSWQQNGIGLGPGICSYINTYYITVSGSIHQKKKKIVQMTNTQERRRNSNSNRIKQIKWFVAVCYACRMLKPREYSSIARKKIKLSDNKIGWTNKLRNKKKYLVWSSFVLISYFLIWESNQPTNKNSGHKATNT